MRIDTMALHEAGHRLRSASAAASAAARALDELVRSTPLRGAEAAKAAGFTDPAGMRAMIRKQLTRSTGSRVA